MSGMFSGMTGAVTQFATGGWKAGIMSMVQTATNFLPPGMAQAAQAAIAIGAAVWKAIKRPSEEEIQARKTFAGMHEIAVSELGGIAEYQDQVATLMADGWDRTLAETVAGFEHWGAEAGIAHDYVVAKYAEYQAAVKAGDGERMAAIEDEVNAWRDAADEKTRIAEEAAAAAEAAWQASSSAAVSAYDKAKQAGIDTYDKILAEAIEAGLGEEEAVRKATAASLAATAKVLAAEGKKYARIAAFDAAMALGAQATQAERAEAARLAAAAATDSWDAAMGAVEASDKAAADAMTGETGGASRIEKDLQEKLIEEGTGALPATTEAMAKMALDSEAAIHAKLLAESGAIPAVAAALGGIPGDAEAMAAGVNAALSKIEREIQIGINHHTTYSSSGSSGPSRGGDRALGGPVSGGRSYLIGERGPELFTPRTGGHVTANRDIIDYDRLAAAIAANPPIIAPDQVAAASLRESPAERAWRGWQ